MKRVALNRVKQANLKQERCCTQSKNNLVSQYYVNFAGEGLPSFSPHLHHLGKFLVLATIPWS